MIKTSELVGYLDEFFRISEIADSSLNGLQVQGPEEISKIAFAVDYSSRAIKQAAEAGAQILVVHHGIFWGKERAIVGLLYHRLRVMFELGVGLYAVHLPLDVHREHAPLSKCTLPRRRHHVAGARAPYRLAEHAAPPGAQLRLP